MTITPTLDLAATIGEDAGNASMRRGGRASWNETDWNMASLAYIAVCSMVFKDAAAIMGDKQGVQDEGADIGTDSRR